MTTSTVTFDIELGRCAVRWSDSGISGVLLPTAGGRSGPRLDDLVSVPPFVRDARNPFPIIVPCHQVVAANGALTGYRQQAMFRDEVAVS
ncbi:MAG TPA: MGMT family protein [Candidatus Dormibacteraeota bacterium]|nr:MGMT family protein [Candidatus Dormibacteraeota bacterium]